MDDIKALLDKLYLWQLTFILSLSLLSMYFTGDTLFGGEIEEGAARANAALYLGIGLLAATIGLRYIPPPNKRINGDRPKTAISPVQMALCAQITELTLFEEAAKLITPDHDLELDELRLKNTEIRLELATLQGLLIRKVNDTGQHLVKYRYSDDATSFVQR